MAALDPMLLVWSADKARGSKGLSVPWLQLRAKFTVPAPTMEIQHRKGSEVGQSRVSDGVADRRGRPALKRS